MKILLNFIKPMGKVDAAAGYTHGVGANMLVYSRRVHTEIRKKNEF